MNNSRFVSESKPIMSDDWSRAYVSLNRHEGQEIKKLRKFHKWMHFVLPDRVFAKIMLKK